AAEMAAREMGGLSLAAALALCELLADTHPARYERAAVRWLQRFIDERLPPLTEVALAASALAELRHGSRNVGADALKRLLRHRLAGRRGLSHIRVHDRCRGRSRRCVKKAPTHGRPCAYSSLSCQWNCSQRVQRQSCHESGERCRVERSSATSQWRASPQHDR